jgi:hypothetical protein
VDPAIHPSVRREREREREVVGKGKEKWQRKGEEVEKRGRR